MKRALKYLWTCYIGVVLAVTGGIALIAMVTSQWLHLEFFCTYYDMLPMMGFILTSIYSFNLIAIYRSMALTMSCRRADFFWGCQAAFVLCALGEIVIVALAGRIPSLLGLEYFSSLVSPDFPGGPSYATPSSWLFLTGAFLCLQPLGASMGSLFHRNKLAATLLYILLLLLNVGATVLFLFVQDGTLGPLPSVFLVVLGAVAVVCEVYFYRSNARAVVR